MSRHEWCGLAVLVLFGASLAFSQRVRADGEPEAYVVHIAIDGAPRGFAADARVGLSDDSPSDLRHLTRFLSPESSISWPVSSGLHPARAASVHLKVPGLYMLNARPGRAEATGDALWPAWWMESGLLADDMLLAIDSTESDLVWRWRLRWRRPSHTYSLRFVHGPDREPVHAQLVDLRTWRYRGYETRSDGVAFAVVEDEQDSGVAVFPERGGPLILDGGQLRELGEDAGAASLDFEVPAPRTMAVDVAMDEGPEPRAASLDAWAWDAETGVLVDRGAIGEGGSLVFAGLPQRPVDVLVQARLLGGGVEHGVAVNQDGERCVVRTTEAGYAYVDGDGETGVELSGEVPHGDGVVYVIPPNGDESAARRLCADGPSWLVPGTYQVRWEHQNGRDEAIAEVLVRHGLVAVVTVRSD